MVGKLEKTVIILLKTVHVILELFAFLTIDLFAYCGIAFVYGTTT